MDFRVFAPRAGAVEVVLAGGGGRHRLQAEPGGYHRGWMAGPAAGTRYGFSLEGGPPLPDPASRLQPEGPLGFSEVVDPGSYVWQDANWPGLARDDQVLYELHLGTFTPVGDLPAAAARLPVLRELGVTAVELMPLNTFPGRFGWGYDGANLFAPYPGYGSPDDLRRFVDAAHGCGLGVILDVVFNHLGPGGEFLERFSASYFSDRYVTAWGAALNFDGEGSEPVREWVIAQGRYWIEEFHVDGFRVDATQNIYDFRGEGEHVLAAFAREARAAAAPRTILVIGENEPQTTHLIRPPEEGGSGFDMLWNDDFHHSAVVALTGRREGYLADHRGAPQEFVSLARRGFLYQGQRYGWQDMPRGTSTDGLDPCQFVAFLENHDQVANMGRGLRMNQLAGPARLRAMTALTLLGPATPMLFQGQEWGSTAPFWFFLDNEGERADQVDAGRRGEVKQFKSLAEEEVQAVLPRPEAETTFTRCKLDWAERERRPQLVALHADLLRLRREDKALRRARRRADGTDGAVLGPEAFCLRFFGGAGDERLLLVNLGADLELAAMPEPLLAPPAGHDWRLLWSSEHPAYGGTGAQHPGPDAPWVLPGRGALLLCPGPPSQARRSEEEKALVEAADKRGDGG